MFWVRIQALLFPGTGLEWFWITVGSLPVLEIPGRFRPDGNGVGAHETGS
jgi:hypothetical protein